MCCSVLQCVAVCRQCISQYLTVTRCNTLPTLQQRSSKSTRCNLPSVEKHTTLCNTASHRNTPQHTAIHDQIDLNCGFFTLILMRDTFLLAWRKTKRKRERGRKRERERESKSHVCEREQQLIAQHNSGARSLLACMSEVLQID